MTITAELRPSINNVIPDIVGLLKDGNVYRQQAGVFLSRNLKGKKANSLCIAC